MLRIFLGNTDVNNFLWYLLNLVIAKGCIMLWELLIIYTTSFLSYRAICFLRKAYYNCFEKGKLYYLTEQKGYLFKRGYICLVMVIWLLFTNFFN